MKCVVGLLFLAVCAVQMISSVPVHRNGMVFYQSQPGYYNAHRAFVMQYASQPIKAYRRNGQAASSGVSAFASGKKIAAGTYLKRKFSGGSVQKFVTQRVPTEADVLEEDEHQVHDQLDGAVHSVAEAYPAEEEDEQVEEEEKTFEAPPQVANDVPEDVSAPETPALFVPSDNKKTPVQHDEEDEEEEELIPVRARKTGAPGATYFPVSFGSTNGGAIAIANSYSTGKGKKIWNCANLSYIRDHRNNISAFFFFLLSRRLCFKSRYSIRICR